METGATILKGSAFGQGVLRWWSCSESCAEPGLNPVPSECNNSCEQKVQFSGPHVGGVIFTFVDGSVKYLNDSMDDQVLKALMTCNGKEVTPGF